MLTTAIGHEMAHIARRDFACNLLYELLLAAGRLSSGGVADPSRASSAPARWPAMKWSPSG